MVGPEGILAFVIANADLTLHHLGHAIKDPEEGLVFVAGHELVESIKFLLVNVFSLLCLLFLKSLTNVSQIVDLVLNDRSLSSLLILDFFNSIEVRLDYLIVLIKLTLKDVQLFVHSLSLLFSLLNGSLILVE